MSDSLSEKGKQSFVSPVIGSCAELEDQSYSGLTGIELTGASGSRDRRDGRRFEKIADGSYYCAGC